MKISSYQHGAPCWIELASEEALSGKYFYSSLFNWQLKDMPIPEGIYTMFAIDDDDIGAMYQLPQTLIDDNILTHWTIYFAVDDLASSIEAVKTNGGKVLIGPHSVGDAGQMAQCQDPEGSVFSLWQAGQHMGSMRNNEANTLCWVELACRQPQMAKAFYAQVLKWQAKETPMADFNYTQWLVDGTAIGGMMVMNEEWGEMPPHWMPYIMVDSCDATAAKAAEIGGKVCVPPTDIEGVGRFSVLNDPQGGFFSVIKLNE
ncbi:glyoxalase [Shewanella colwelliana]|uniref:Glyoxalase n=1 Tax=Shewanella colwelliana TaxID=23 RepID=A0ABQ4NWU3_SHECO|nr:VOC family protein [Shewanella colwelliana]MDX1281079.1 VOC family protein [Shewanella colwelliana]GIU27809.1 glyoxalase [Shewanella colwelliana]GIU38140.1 glyoxalase [Shewanella colwelliana]